MTQDAELIETVRGNLSHPVSEQEAREARTRLVRDAAGGALIMLAIVLYRAFEDGPHSMSVAVPLLLSMSIAWNVIRHYRVARPRPATPVPDDILAWNVKQFTRCFACRAITKAGALACPKCGASPAARLVLIACLIGASCVFLIWLSLR